MTEQTKAIFNDPQLLRQKLTAFLQSPDKVETYALAAEKFFAAGDRQHLCFKETWSWWAFLFPSWFFLYRKEYVKGVSIFLLECIFYLPIYDPNSTYISNAELVLIGIYIIISIVSGVCAKYIVINNFKLALKFDNFLFIKMSGKNTWAIFAGILAETYNVISALY